MRVDSRRVEALLSHQFHRAMRSAAAFAADAVDIDVVPHEPVTTNIAHLVRNNIYVYGIRGEGRSATHRAMELMAEKRFDATRIHTHTFPLADLPTALRYARERVEDAIKVVVTNRQAGAIASAAE